MKSAFPFTQSSESSPLLPSRKTILYEHIFFQRLRLQLLALFLTFSLHKTLLTRLSPNKQMVNYLARGKGPNEVFGCVFLLSPSYVFDLN